MIEYESQELEEHFRDILSQLVKKEQLVDKNIFVRWGNLSEKNPSGTSYNPIENRYEIFISQEFPLNNRFATQIILHHELLHIKYEHPQRYQSFIENLYALDWSKIDIVSEIKKLLIIFEKQVYIELVNYYSKKELLAVLKRYYPKEKLSKIIRA